MKVPNQRCPKYQHYQCFLLVPSGREENIRLWNQAKSTTSKNKKNGIQGMHAFLCMLIISYSVEWKFTLGSISAINIVWIKFYSAIII